ncbi:MAG TPA: hypothetical protein VKV95_22780 [Terriglobia bacterium]|nr:hypothetical protein [Terriglobia bacterium]
MNEVHTPELTQGQARTLQKLLQAGFQFASIEHVARHIVVEKDGFIALLDPANRQLRVFGQMGYRVGDGIGMLIERGTRRAFVWKKESVEATSDLLSSYERVKSELTGILKNNSEV